MTKEERQHPKTILANALTEYNKLSSNRNKLRLNNLESNMFCKAMQEYADQQTKDKDKEIEELKEREDELLESRSKFASQSTDRLIEITQLKQQLKEKSERIKELGDTIDIDRKMLAEKSEEVDKVIDLVKKDFNDLKLVDNKHYGWDEYDVKYRLKKIYKLLNKQ
jgi:chromosome segregation ATPase